MSALIGLGLLAFGFMCGALFGATKLEQEDSGDTVHYSFKK